MRQTPFTVNVAGLRRTPGSRRQERRQGPIARLEVSGSGVPPDAEVAVDVVLESVPGAVIARGSVVAPWRGACRRCLEEATGEVRADVVEVFEEDHDPEHTYPLWGDQLDLEPMARDAVLLELPLAPLCREECRGLCPSCGANLNEGGCSCQRVPEDPRWAALDALRDR
ncbi:MAG: DUF177 domain-containing protein [Actinomycetota bacterium]|nr:DUF177 domain-containing protein [Actinomycetota bacterium]